MTCRKAKDENYSRAQRLKARQKEAEPIIAEIKAVPDAIAQVALPEKISENICKKLYPFGSREKDYNRICFLML